jgi:hypothetical protein
VCLATYLPISVLRKGRIGVVSDGVRLCTVCLVGVRCVGDEVDLVSVVTADDGGCGGDNCAGNIIWLTE